MNKTFKLALLIGVVVFVALACSSSFTTAHFSDTYMAKDSEGKERTTVFGQNDIFYAIVVLVNAPDDTKVRAEWYAVDVQGEQPNTLIDDASIVSNDDTLYFNLTNAADALWPIGKYRVDLYINDKLETTLEFTVQ